MRYPRFSATPRQAASRKVKQLRAASNPFDWLQMAVSMRTKKQKEENDELRNNGERLVRGFPFRSGFEGKNWELCDCMGMHRKNEDTFEVPSVTEIKALKVGDNVKLIFNLKKRGRDGPSGERMWVQIYCVPTSGEKLIFRGHLSNPPGIIRGLYIGDALEFERRHIATVE